MPGAAPTVSCVAGGPGHPGQSDRIAHGPHASCPGYSPANFAPAARTDPVGASLLVATAPIQRLPSTASCSPLHCAASAPTARRCVGSLVAFAGSALIAVSHGGVQFGTAALIVLAAAVARGVYHTAHKPLLSRYTGFKVTVYADVAGTLFVLPWSPALVRALPHAGTAARSGLCGRLRPGDPRIRHRRPLTDDPAEHGTAKRTLMAPLYVIPE
jgi:hypothetical protein